MQASSTLDRSGFSRRMLAFVIALIAALALGTAAGFATRSWSQPSGADNSTAAPAADRSTLPLYPIVDEQPLSVNVVPSPSAAPVCDPEICDPARYGLLLY